MRWGGRATIDGGLVLEIGKLLRDCMIAPSSSSRGSIRFGGSSSISYAAVLSEDRGSLTLRYTHRGMPVRVPVGLATSPQPFGGVRWWFVCPVTGRRVAKLYSPAGYSRFASRDGLGLGYRSQRLSPKDRIYRRVHGLRADLGGDGAIGTPIAKPKGMRWATYDKRMAAVHRAEAKTLSGLYAAAMALHEQLQAAQMRKRG